METKHLPAAVKITFSVLFLICSLLAISQNAYVRTLNSDFFTVFEGSTQRKTVSNGKDLVTWNVESQQGFLPSIALMDTNMNVAWCKEYSVLNFVNTSFNIQNVTFDENDNLIVCGTATMSNICSILLRIDRTNGAMIWNMVVDSVDAVTAYGVNKQLFFFGNKYRANSVVSHMSKFDSTGIPTSYNFLNVADSINGQYRITDAIRLNKDRHIIYLSPMAENKGNNMAKLISTHNYMYPIWERGYKELGYVSDNNKSLIAVSDSEFVVNNLERDSTLFKFSKTGQLIWGKKYSIGGSAQPHVIAGNLLLLSRAENGGSELLINESTGSCVGLTYNLLCEPLVGNYSNRLNYYHKNGMYQFCSAANYFAVANGCAGSGFQLPFINFNTVAIHHNYGYTGCAFQSASLPSYSTRMLTACDSVCDFSSSSLNCFFCNVFVENNISFHSTFIQDACGLALAVGEQQGMDQKLNLFPNPAKNTLNIEWPGGGRIEIVNGQGRICATQEMNNAQELTSIDVSVLVDGFYILKIVNANSFVTRKFFKE